MLCQGGNVAAHTNPHLLQPMDAVGPDTTNGLWRGRQRTLADPLECRFTVQVNYIILLLYSCYISVAI